MVGLFWDDSQGIFYDVAAGLSGLFQRARSLQDGAVPSGSSVATMVLLKLARITDNQEYSRIAERSLNTPGKNMARYPLGFGQWLSALDFYMGPSQEVAIIGAPDNADTLSLLHSACREYRPNTIITGLAPSDTTLLSQLPIFANRRQPAGIPTAFVCRGFSCLPPVTTAEELENSLEL